MSFSAAQGAIGESDAFGGAGLAVEGPGADVEGAAEGGENGVFEDGRVAEHFVLPGGAGDTGVHSDGVGDGEEAGGGFGAALAVGPDGAGGALAVVVTFADDVPEAPGEDFAGARGGWVGDFGALRWRGHAHGLLGTLSIGHVYPRRAGGYMGGIGEEFLHEAVGDVHGGEGVDGAADDGELGELDGAGGELGGGPDGGVEEFGFVAAEFLDAGAADGAVGLGEDFGDGAVGEFEAAAGGGVRARVWAICSDSKSFCR